MTNSSNITGESLLYLTDNQLRQGIEAMFFAYRGFTADPDRILEEYGYGRAHHRAVHFINGSPGTTVNNLLNILGVTKQSLNRVLRTLVNDALVEVKVGTQDKRERHLYLTNQGRELQERLSSAQSNRMRKAFKYFTIISTFTFKYRTCIMHGMGKNMNISVSPINEVSI